MVSVVEALVIIQYSVLVVRSGYTGNVVVGIKGSIYKVMKTFVCRGCIPLTGIMQPLQTNVFITLYDVHAALYTSTFPVYPHLTSTQY